MHKGALGGYWLRQLNVQLGELDSTRPIVSGTREELVSFLSDVVELQQRRTTPPWGNDRFGFEISLPCGCERIFTRESDIPDNDLYCQCGKYLMITVKGG